MTLELDLPGTSAIGKTLNDAIREMVAEEAVKAVMAQQATFERLVRSIVGSIGDIRVQVGSPTNHFAPIIGAPQVNVPAPMVDVTMDMEEMCACLVRIEGLLQTLVAAQTSPVTREVHRNSEGNIDYMVERRG